MTRIAWDAIGEKAYETGTDRGVIYVSGLAGAPWNGLTSVTESPSGGSSTPYYLDGVKILNVPGSEEFNATLDAFTYPYEFTLCEGVGQPYTGLFVTQQKRKSFGLSYRTIVGNDTEGNDNGYKIHLVYNALAEPSQRAHKSLGETTDLTAFSWNVSTKPIIIPGFKRTSHFVIDSRITNETTLSAIEDILYGTDATAPRLPLPDEIFTIFELNSTFVVVDNGDGTWTATGTDFEVHMLDATTFEIVTPAAVFIDADSYTLTSH